MKDRFLEIVEALVGPIEKHLEPFDREQKEMLHMLFTQLRAAAEMYAREMEEQVCALCGSDTRFIYLTKIDTLRGLRQRLIDNGSHNEASMVDDEIEMYNELIRKN